MNRFSARLAPVIRSISRQVPARRAALAVAALSSQLLLAACGSDSNNAQPQIPLVSFNQQIYLTDQAYVRLRSDNGAAYTEGGVKGLIIVRQNASTYYAFERNCPYRPSDACSRVSIDASRLFLRDSCCGSEFDLQGRVRTAPATLSLRRYTTTLSGNVLTITN